MLFPTLEEITVADGQEVKKLLSNNKFSPLAEENNNNNNANSTAGKSTPVVPESGKSAGEKKQPSLVVKNTSFARLAKVMSTCNVQPEHKLTRYGTKITCFSSDDFNTVQAHLKKNKVEFYTYGRRGDRPHRVVMRCLPNLEPDYIKELLKSEHQLDAFEVHAIKRKQQLPAIDETPFVVLFPKGHTSLKELSSKAKKVGLVVVRWVAYRNKEPHVTQCKNCLQFGHGTSNCHLKPRCSSCRGAHSTEKCSGSHEGLDRSCPKRAQFIQSRQQASKPKPPAWKKEKQTPAAAAFTAADFPPLPGAVPSIGTEEKHPRPAGRSRENTGAGAGATPKDQPGERNLYSESELWAIYRDYRVRLRQCKTPEEQIDVIAHLLTHGAGK